MHLEKTHSALSLILLVGQEVEVDMENDTLTDVESGKIYNLKPLGEVGNLFECP